MQETVRSFRDLNAQQKRYFQTHCFDHVALESRNRMVCSDCGHTWKVQDGQSMEEVKCPHCHHKCTVEHHKTQAQGIEYFVISKAIQGYQVLRFFQVRRFVKPNDISYSHNDCGTIFIDEKGKLTEFTLKRAPMSCYLDSWSFGSQIEYRQCEVLNQLGATGLITYSMIPVLKRNGYDGKLWRYRTSELIKLLLTNPQAESWWKTGYKGLVSEALSYSKFSETEQRLIKLAIRHKRHFDTRDEWIDFKDFIKDLKYLGKDIFNPSVIFPANFQEAHQLWHERAERKREKEREEAERRRRVQEYDRMFNLAKTDKKKAEWLNHYVLVFGTADWNKEGFRLKPLVTPDDFQAEADYMHHCIRSYYGKENTLLMSISINDERQETAEINLVSGNVVQCRGIYNQPSQYHDKIVKLLNKCMRLFRAYNDGKYLNKQATQQTAATEIGILAA